MVLDVVGVDYAGELAFLSFFLKGSYKRLNSFSHRQRAHRHSGKRPSSITSTLTKKKKHTVSDTRNHTPSAGVVGTELSTDNTSVRVSIYYCDFTFLLLMMRAGTECAQCGYPSAKLRSYEWGQKAKRRKTTGTGRMRYLKHVARRFKNGFRWVVCKKNG
jgi:hypothetical protein